MEYFWSPTHPFCVQTIWQQDGQVAYIEIDTFERSGTPWSTIIKPVSEFYAKKWYKPAYIPGSLFIYKKVLCYVHDYKLNSKDELVYVCKALGEDKKWTMREDQIRLSYISPGGMPLKMRNHPKCDYRIQSFPEVPVSWNSRSIRVLKVTPKKRRTYCVSFRELFQEFWLPYRYTGNEGLRLFFKESFRKVPQIFSER